MVLFGNGGLDMLLSHDSGCISSGDNGLDALNGWRQISEPDCCKVRVGWMGCHTFN